MTLTRKHFKELAVILGRHQGKVLSKEFHANLDLFEELTEFLQSENKNFSYSIFLDAFHDATEKYLREKEKDNANKNALRNAMSKPVVSLDDIEEEDKPKRKFSDNKYASFKFGLDKKGYVTTEE